MAWTDFLDGDIFDTIIKVGSKAFGKTINNDPENYFTQDILEKLDAACTKEFKYGDVIDTEDTTNTQDE